MAQSNVAAEVHRLQTPLHNRGVGKANTPHFMSPTIASKLSQVTPPDSRPTTPVSIKSVKSDGGQSLLQSAVQRVSRRRAATNVTTREHSRSPAKHNKAVSFPDKLSTPTCAHASTPPTISSVKDEVRQDSPLDKPLPALPKITLNAFGPMTSSASFIKTASDPLPSSMSEATSAEERGAQKPLLVLRSDSLRRTMAKTGHSLVEQSSPCERYPKLGDTTQQRQSSQHRPIISRYSHMFQESTQGPFSITVSKASSGTSDFNASGSMEDPFETVAETTRSHLITETDQRLSVAAAALEKSTSEISKDQMPRQTRTSSLRARLSAGQLIKDSQNKILGFTDFTVPRNSLDPLVDTNQLDSLSAQKQPSSRHLVDVPKPSLQRKGSKSSLQKKESVQSLHSNHSTESLVKGHAPAQFVGGSRRAISGPRPTSRNGNRSTSIDSQPVPASRQPQASLPMPSKTLVSTRDNVAVETQAKPQKSSIPVPTHVALQAKFKPETTTATARSPMQTNPTLKKAPRNETLVRKDLSTAEVLFDLESKAKLSFKNRGANQIFKDAVEYRSLAAIEESPPQSFTLKRLSVKSPEYGPKLRISPSAERFIMGNTDDKENQFVPGKSTKKVFHRATNGVHKQQRTGVNVTLAPKRRPDRPVSSHGVLQSSPRVPNFDPQVRERKAKSADLSSSLSLPLVVSSDPTRHDMGASMGSKASSNDLSFVSAVEGYSQDAQENPQKSSSQKEPGAVVDEAAWISGPKEKMSEQMVDPSSTNSTAISSSVASLNDNAQPEKISVNSPRTDDEVQGTDDSTPTSSKSTSTVKHIPFTPLDTIGKVSSRPSCRHPPRSSSRVAQPNLTTPSPPGPRKAEKGPPTPPKDEARQQDIQNSLGSRHGHASWQIDPIDMHSTPVSFSARKGKHDKRDSASTSVSAKKSFSSFRNLFNKRTPAADSLKPKTAQETPSKASARAKKPTLKIKEVSKKATHKAKDVSKLSTSSPYTPMLSRQSPSIDGSTPASSLNFAPSPRKSTSSTVKKSSTSTATSPTPVTTIADPTSLASPTPVPMALSSSTNLAMRLLDAAVAEQSSPKKEKLLQMSKILVDAVTQARDAEKAAEEAKIASRKAEMAKDICGKMVEEVGRVVGEWSAAVMEGGGRKA